MTKAIGGLLAATLAVIFTCAAGIAMFFSGPAAGCALPAVALSGATGTISPPPGGWRPIGEWDADQVANAATIVTVGVRIGVPPRGWVIALATAMQESSLINRRGGDQDSVGLFQQRPSQGWGTPEQLHDPTYAATKFYAKLLTINGWQSMRLTDVAQAVQRSAFPDAYARWEPDATQLVGAVGSSAKRALSVDLERCPSNCPPILSSGSGSWSGGSASPGATAGADTGCAAVLARAAGWLTAWAGGPVPYLSSAEPATWFGGYRRDCSGFASMALGLPGPGLDAAALAARSVPIARAALRGGDLLINPAAGAAGHVVIFDRWADPSMTVYLGYEQSADGGTHHRLIPYPYLSGYQLAPFRFVSNGALSVAG
ncbi:MAG TPA: NlpC/P60 family protein [Planosporangium sp.]|jgi:hypothetical protein|nr:NlpC/P60 family protein [Planosporangium sp.]